MSRANLSRALLDDATLIGAQLIGTNLSRAFLDRANLSGAVFVEANLRGAFLDQANLSAARLGAADLRRATLRGAKNLFVKQLTKAATLYEAELDDTLMEKIKRDYPHLLANPG